MTNILKYLSKIEFSILKITYLDLLKIICINAYKMISL